MLLLFGGMVVTTTFVMVSSSSPDYTPSGLDALVCRLQRWFASGMPVFVEDIFGENHFISYVNVDVDTNTILLMTDYGILLAACEKCKGPVADSEALHVVERVTKTSTRNLPERGFPVSRNQAEALWKSGTFYYLSKYKRALCSKCWDGDLENRYSYTLPTTRMSFK